MWSKAHLAVVAFYRTEKLRPVHARAAEGHRRGECGLMDGMGQRQRAEYANIFRPCCSAVTKAGIEGRTICALGPERRPGRPGFASAIFRPEMEAGIDQYTRNAFKASQCAAG